MSNISVLWLWPHTFMLLWLHCIKFIAFERMHMTTMTIKEVTYLEYSPLGNASNTADTFVPYLKILKLKVTTRMSSFLHS